MDKIDMMVEMLPSYNKDKHTINNVEKLDVEKGKAIAINIFRPADKSVSTTHIRAWPDTKFLEHYYNEQEVIRLFKGDLTVVINGNEKVLIAGDTIIIDTKTPHWGFTKKGCEFITITVPASKGFPK